MYVTGFIYTVLKAGHNKMGSANWQLFRSKHRQKSNARHAELGVGVGVKVSAVHRQTSLLAAEMLSWGRRSR